jgi:hypothetical protein
MCYHCQCSLSFLFLVSRAKSILFYKESQKSNHLRVLLYHQKESVGFKQLTKCPPAALMLVWLPTNCLMAHWMEFGRIPCRSMRWWTTCETLLGYKINIESWGVVSRNHQECFKLVSATKLSADQSPARLNPASSLQQRRYPSVNTPLSEECIILWVETLAKAALP